MKDNKEQLRSAEDHTHIKSVAEIKDDAARMIGYSEWNEAIHENGAAYMETLIDQMMYAYAEQFRRLAKKMASQFKPSGVKTFALEDFIHKWVGILERIYPMDAGTQSQLINELRKLKYDN